MTLSPGNQRMSAGRQHEQVFTSYTHDNTLFEFCYGYKSALIGAVTTRASHLRRYRMYTDH